MSSRLLRLLVLGFTCLWFGMLVPVHTRGQIQLGGGCHSAKDESACHGKCGKTDKQSPTPEQKENCAVCHFILGLDVPPPVTVCEARLGFLELIPSEIALIAPLRHAALPFHGLDPPAA